jgi:hypothetical protein
MRRALALALAALLGACTAGEGPDDQGPSAARSMGEAVRARLGLAEPDDAPRIDRALLARAGITERFLLVTLESGTTAGLTPIAANRGRLVWSTEDNITLTGRGGILSATRGLGGDLLSAETEPLLFALAEGRGARYRRTLRRLDGLDRILVQPYDCVLSTGPRERVVVLGRAHDTLRSTERCRPIGDDAPEGTPDLLRPEPFTNVYNVGDGTIWTSRQYVGRAVGHLTMERVLE